MVYGPAMETKASAKPPPLAPANPAWTRSVHLDAPGQRHGQQPVSGTADPGVVKQGKRVGMHSDEKPRGAAKGKQTNTMASCQPPPPTARH